jgi:heavy metal translocating P-type ATPase
MELGSDPHRRPATQSFERVFTEGQVESVSITSAPAKPRPACGGLFGEADLSQERLLRRNVTFLAISALCMLSSGAIGLWARSSASWTDAGHVISFIGLALGLPMYWIAVKTVVLARSKLTTEVFITIALAAVTYEGQYWYAAWVVFVLWLGETLMAWAGRQARSAVGALLGLIPRQARVAGPDGTRMVPVEQVEVGDIVVVHPGERIPLDGVLVQGETTVDESMLTGEAVPADHTVGDHLFAGTANLHATIRVRATTTTEDNTVTGIVTLMRQAQAAHIPAKRTVDLFLRWFLPLVLAGAALTGFLTGSLERVAAILLVITPCAFSASTPLALIATIGVAARLGIVIKGGTCIEALSRVDVVLLDKTGTLTASTPQLSVIEAIGRTDDEVLTAAAIAERPSSHPLARAVCAAADERGLAEVEPDEFELASGHGVIASYAGHRLAVGSARFLDRRDDLVVPGSARDRAASLEAAGYTIAYVLEQDTVIGILGFLAQPRPSAPAVIAGLRRLGMRRLIMVTGDRSRPARAVAARLGIDHEAEATPAGKLSIVRRWQDEGHTVAMVGDGINDATALAAADVGIAMVSAGAEVSALAADVVIHGDRLSRVLAAARLSRRGTNTIKTNILFATGYNLIGLMLALAGVIGPGEAVLFHCGSFITVVLNSAFMLSYNPKVPDEPAADKEQPSQVVATAA